MTNTAISPEAYTASEQIDETQDYAQIGGEIIGYAANHNPRQVKAQIDEMLDSIQADAAAGKLKTRKGVEIGADQIEQQLEVMLSVYNGKSAGVENPSFSESEAKAVDDDPLVLLPSAGGIRSASRALIENPLTAQSFLKSIEERMKARKEREAGGAAIEETTSREVESASKDLAQGMSAGVLELVSPQVAEFQEEPEAEAKPEDFLERLTEGLSESDRIHLARHADALQYKYESQLDKDGHMSARWGQIAGQHYRDLSPAARDIASRYAHTYRYQNYKYGNVQ